MMRRLATLLALRAAAANHMDWNSVDELFKVGVDQLQYELKEMKKNEKGKQTAVVAQGANANNVTLATFDKAKGTTFTWRAMNDPVMGGQSHSSFSIEAAEGHFSGTCAVVPFLNAPGFCKVGTQRSLIFGPPHFADASAFYEGALLLEVETTTPEYEGFKVAFGAKGAVRPPGAMHHSPPSFKAPFKVPGKGRTIVKVPFTDFSVDWSDFTGRCDTKDPRDGFQHHCCSMEHPEVCPRAEHLARITSLEIWAEGVAGDFDLSVVSIGAGPLGSRPSALLV